MAEKSKGSIGFIIIGIIVLAAMVGIPAAMQTSQWVTQASSDLGAIIFGTPVTYATTNQYGQTTVATTTLETTTGVQTTTAQPASLILTLQGNFGMYDSNDQPIQQSTLEMFEWVAPSSAKAVSKLGYDVGYTIDGQNVDWDTLLVTWQINGITYQLGNRIGENPNLDTGELNQRSGAISAKHNLGALIPSNADTSRDIQVGFGISMTASAYKAGMPHTAENLVVAASVPVVGINSLQWLFGPPVLTQTGRTVVEKTVIERTARTTDVTDTGPITPPFTGVATAPMTGVVVTVGGQQVNYPLPSPTPTTEAVIAADLAVANVQATRDTLRGSQVERGERSPTPEKEVRLVTIERALPSESLTKNQIKSRGTSKYIFSIFDAQAPIQVFGAEPTGIGQNTRIFFIFIGLVIFYIYLRHIEGKDGF